MVGFRGPCHGPPGWGRLHPLSWEGLGQVPGLGGPGALGVKEPRWLNSECVKAREIRLQRQTEVMINFSSLHTVSSLPTVVFPCEHSAGLAWPWCWVVKKEKE